MTEVGYGDGGVMPTVYHTYDRRGRKLTTATSGSGGMTTTYAYNDANLPLSETYSGGVLNGLAVSWSYDSSLRRDGVSANTAPEINQNYGYDTAGRLQTVSDGSYSATYAYHANSRLISTVTSKQSTTPRLTVSRNYDRLNRLQSIQNTPATAGQLPDLSAYGYNDANQRVRRTLADGSYWVYTYDALGQVTSGKRYWNDGTPVASQQFEYTFDDNRQPHRHPGRWRLERGEPSPGQLHAQPAQPIHQARHPHRVRRAGAGHRQQHGDDVRGRNTPVGHLRARGILPQGGYRREFQRS